VPRKTIHQETLCCGAKRCPTVKLFDDGSMELTDDDTAVGAIKLTPEQVERLVELAKKV
jgi:hypothetical protein